MDSDESTPLLARHTHTQDNKRDWWAHSSLFLVFLVNFLLQGGQLIAVAPRVQIYESILCEDFSSRNIGEAVPIVGDRCKDADVQAELAFILGMEEFLTVFLSVLTIPYSALADRYGWSLILSLSLCGVALETIWPFFICLFVGRISLYWVLLAVVFEAIGGGITVSVTMINLILFVLVSQESRTRIFLYLTASSLIATATSQVVSTILMRRDVWLPAYIGCGLNILAFGLSFVLTQTMAKRTAHCSTDVNHREREPSSRSYSIKELCLKLLIILRSNPQVVIVLISAFAFPLGEDSMFTIILLYISKRYGWTIADANFLVAFSSIAKLFTYLVGLPGLGYMLMKYRGVSSFVRDRIIVLVESLFLLVGALWIALAPTAALAFSGIIVMSFGMAIVTVLRSLVSDLVRPQEITIVYSLMSMMMRIGSGIAGPVFAWGFDVGMKLGPSWTGLPFLIAAACCFAGMVALSFLAREPRLESDEEPQGTHTFIGEEIS